MYYLPAGTRCSVIVSGREPREHVTTKELAFHEYSERFENGFIFGYGEYLIIVDENLVQERVLHRVGPKHVGELLARSELLRSMHDGQT